MTDVRTGQAPDQLTRDEFHDRFVVRFYDPAFRVESDAITRLEDIAWGAYKEGRKSPITRPAGPGFADPAYDLSVEWRETSDKLKDAQKRWGDPATGSRVLLICGR